MPARCNAADAQAVGYQGVTGHRFCGAMRTFNLISNISNGAGLQKDTELLRGLIESHGHSVTCTMFNESAPTFRPHDVNIFLEVVTPQWLQFGKQNWIVPNSEWWYPCWDPVLPRINKVLCKTKDCHEIWTRKAGSRAIYIGFEANDFYKSGIQRKPTFLHLAGKSETKNTAAVMEAWRNFNLPYPLIISAFKPGIVELCQGVKNVTQVHRFGDSQAVEMLNECQFHIMPSKNEGFGHAIHEALGCKGIVITTDAAPMNQFTGVDKRLLIPVARKVPRLLTFFHEVSGQDVAAAVHKAAQLYPDELEAIGNAAREGFIADRTFFREKFAEVVNGI